MGRQLAAFVEPVDTGQLDITVVHDKNHQGVVTQFFAVEESEQLTAGFIERNRS